MPSDWSSVGRSDAGELQQLRRVVGAGRQDDLAPRPHLARGAAASALEVAHADRALALQHEVGGVGVREHAQVRPPHGRMQEGARGADPPAVQDGALGVGDAFLDLAVVVGIAGDAGLDRTFDEGVAQGMAPVDVGDGEVAVAAAEGRIAVADAPLHAPEIGEHVGVAPAAVAELRPGVEVHGLAAIVDVAVDRAGAAQRLAARGEDAPPAGPRAGLHAVEPVHARIVVGLDEAGGDVDVGVPVARARLEHAHAGLAVRGQPVGEHAAGRARADDHIVIRLQAAPPLLMQMRGRQTVSGCRDCAVQTQMWWQMIAVASICEGSRVLSG